MCWGGTSNELEMGEVPPHPFVNLFDIAFSLQQDPYFPVVRRLSVTDLTGLELLVLSGLLVGTLSELMQSFKVGAIALILLSFNELGALRGILFLAPVHKWLMQDVSSFLFAPSARSHHLPDLDFQALVIQHIHSVQRATLFELHEASHWICSEKKHPTPVIFWAPYD